MSKVIWQIIHKLLDSFFIIDHPKMMSKAIFATKSYSAGFDVTILLQWHQFFQQQDRQKTQVQHLRWCFSHVSCGLLLCQPGEFMFFNDIIKVIVNRSTKQPSRIECGHHGLGINVKAVLWVLNKPLFLRKSLNISTAFSYTSGECSSVPAGNSISGLIMRNSEYWFPAASTRASSELRTS
jgi:hypothetical protein